MRIIIKLGGSLIQDANGEIRINYLTKLIGILKLLKEKNEMAIVVGGGKSARSYISTARELGAPEAFSDEIGIEIAKVHARLLISALGELAFPKTFDSLQEAVSAFVSGKIIVLGGLQPGQSTNAVACLLAERLNANLLINATNVSGIYTADPNKDPSAKKIDVLHISDFRKLIKEKSKAGEYSLFDYVAYLIIKRSKVPTIFISGEQPENILKIVNGEYKIGTKIVYE